MVKQADTTPATARAGRLVGALMCCSAGRHLLEDARVAGIDLGNPRGNAASSLQLSSTALFMVQDVYALCQQVNPAGPPAKAFDRAALIGQQLIQTAKREIWAEPVVKKAITTSPARRSEYAL